MVGTVFAFGLMNVLFEYVLLCMLSPRMRLRLLGSEGAKRALHFGFLILNLTVHWGTLLGTMSAILSFICSIVTVRIASAMFGYIKGGRHYTTGWIKYSAAELR